MRRAFKSPGPPSRPAFQLNERHWTASGAPPALDPRLLRGRSSIARSRLKLVSGLARYGMRFPGALGGNRKAPREICAESSPGETGHRRARRTGDKRRRTFVPRARSGAPRVCSSLTDRPTAKRDVWWRWDQILLYLPPPKSTVPCAPAKHKTASQRGHPSEGPAGPTPIVRACVPSKCFSDL
jgi:hypothetical protein